MEKEAVQLASSRTSSRASRRQSRRGNRTSSRGEQFSKENIALQNEEGNAEKTRKTGDVDDLADDLFLYCISGKYVVIF